MNPERQFWGWVLALCAAIFFLVGIQAGLFYLNHGMTLATLPPRERTNLIVFLVLALLSLLPFLVWGMRIWYRRYVLPLHRITEDVEALLYGSPRARVALDHDDPAGLAPLLNALMERYQQGGTAGDSEATALRAERDEERIRHALVLDTLQEGVVVCSGDGRVLAVNRMADERLGISARASNHRHLADLIGAEAWQFAQEALQAQLGTGVANPELRFDTDEAPGVPAGASARLAPLLVLGGRLDGYVLSLREPDGGGSPSVVQSAAEAPLGRAMLDTPLSDLRYLVFDTETTGLRPAEGDAVISLGAVPVAEGRVVTSDALDELVDPGRPISPASQRVHGISQEAVTGKPPLRDVLPAFMRLAERAVLVAHNAAFDMAFLRPVAAELGTPLDHPVLDTMLLSAVVHPLQQSHRLDALLARYGIAPEIRHSALGDALMTAQLLLCLLPLLERRGVVTLGQALEASRRTGLAGLRYE